MDTVLRGGGYLLKAGGLPETADGERALIERARLRLTVKRGSFAYDPSLGSDFHLISAPGAAAQDMARAALRPLTNVQVLSAVWQAAGRVTVTVLCNGITEEIGVVQDGEL